MSLLAKAVTILLLALGVLLGVKAAWNSYTGMVAEIATLKQANAQLQATIQEQEKAKSELRADIKLRDDIGTEYREWKNGLDATIREASMVLEQDSAYTSWGSEPLPHSVLDAVRLLQKH